MILQRRCELGRQVLGIGIVGVAVIVVAWIYRDEIGLGGSAAQAKGLRILLDEHALLSLPLRNRLPHILSSLADSGTGEGFILGCRPEGSTKGDDGGGCEFGVVADRASVLVSDCSCWRPSGET